MVHAIGGTVFSYLDLVARLAPGRACYGIQAKGVSEGEPPAEMIEGMARQYIELLDDKLAGRPYHLFGWSFGGVVAIEMARQLARTGRQPASITLLDSFAPQPLPDPHVRVAMFARDLGLLDVQPTELIGMDLDQAYAHVVARAAKHSKSTSNIAVAELSRFQRVFEANIVAEGRYKAEPFNGDVTLITASETPATDRSYGYRSLITGTLMIRQTPGDHYSVLRAPGVDILGHTLDEVLASAETRVR